jgi:hypothetical protein
MASAMMCQTCGRRYGCIKKFKHHITGKIIRAEDYGYECFPIKRCRCRRR